MGRTIVTIQNRNVECACLKNHKDKDKCDDTIAVNDDLLINYFDEFLEVDSSCNNIETLLQGFSPVFLPWK